MKFKYTTTPAIKRDRRKYERILWNVIRRNYVEDQLCTAECASISIQLGGTTIRARHSDLPSTALSCRGGYLLQLCSQGRTEPGISAVNSAIGTEHNDYTHFPSLYGQSNMIARIILPAASSAVPVLPAPPRNTAFSGPPVPYSFGNTPVPTFPASCPGADEEVPMRDSAVMSVRWTVIGRKKAPTFQSRLVFA